MMIAASAGVADSGMVVVVAVVVKINNRELKQRRRRRQQEREKAMGSDWLNNNFTHESCFFVHFFAAAARLQRESAKFHVSSRTWTRDNNFPFLFLNFDTVF